MTKKKNNKKVSRFEKLEQEAKNFEEAWKKALADYQNLEKRIEKEKEVFIKSANQKLLLRILEVVDDLEKAEDYLEDEGLSLAIAKLKKILKEEGLEKIKTKSKTFDPEKMECIEIVKGDKGKVIKEVQKGYMINGKVLRPARVKVGGGKK